MRLLRTAFALSAVLLASSAALAPAAEGQPGGITPTGFSLKQEVMVAGAPADVYDAITGDITPWWDHSFSGKPHRLYIEAKPGGGFYEVFDESGDGVRHAVVTWAQRGTRLRFEGPLGLAGAAVHMVTTYDFAAEGDSTRITLTVNATGEVAEGMDRAVAGVWQHFLVQRFKPYFESRRP